MCDIDLVFYFRESTPVLFCHGGVLSSSPFCRVQKTMSKEHPSSSFSLLVGNVLIFLFISIFRIWNLFLT